MRSLHDREGLRPDFRMPTVEICRLEAKDFKRFAVTDPELHGTVMEWLRLLALHPATPGEAMRERGHLHVFSLAAISQFPWWQIESIRLDPGGKPIPDRSQDWGEPRFQSVLVYPAIRPPVSLVEAMDEANDGKLSRRGDGGPKPGQRAGTGLLPPKTPLRR